MKDHQAPSMSPLGMPSAGRSKFDESLKAVVREQQVLRLGSASRSCVSALRLGPTSRSIAQGSKLVSKCLNKNCVREALGMSDDLDNFTKSHLVEGLEDAAGIHSTHRVVGSIVGVTLNSALRGDATMECNLRRVCCRT